jgi:ribosomal protein L6P/L9E
MGRNYVQDHPNYTFEELEQAFCKQLITIKNDEEVYIQLRNKKTTNHQTCWGLLWTHVEIN